MISTYAIGRSATVKRKLKAFFFVSSQYNDSQALYGDGIYILRETQQSVLSTTLSSGENTQVSETLTLNFDPAQFNNYRIYYTILAQKGDSSTFSISTSGTTLSVSCTVYNPKAGSQEVFVRYRIWIYEVF